MQKQRRRDTQPELALRRILFSRGLRYRVDHKLPLPRKRGDIVFPGRRVVVFVDGCFWHGCPEHGTIPKKNRAWWKEKIESNIERDRATDLKLGEMGWKVVRVWEHESPDDAANRVVNVIGGIFD